MPIKFLVINHLKLFNPLLLMDQLFIKLFLLLVFVIFPHHLYMVDVLIKITVLYLNLFSEMCWNHIVLINFLVKLQLILNHYRTNKIIFYLIFLMLMLKYMEILNL